MMKCIVTNRIKISIYYIILEKLYYKHYCSLTRFIWKPCIGSTMGQAPMWYV